MEAVDIRSNVMLRAQEILFARNPASQITET